MKGDVSRIKFDESRFARVVAQQGRIQLDSDWNEQQAILDYRLQALTADAFGHGGLLSRVVAPRARAGFGLHVHRGGILDSSATRPSVALAPALGTAFTIAAWFKPHAIVAGADPATTPARMIAERRDGERVEFTLALDAANHVIFDRIAAAGASPHAVTSRRPVSADRFCYIVGIDTGDALELWIDGEIDTRVAASSTSIALAGVPILLGPTGGGPLGEFERFEVWTQRLVREDVLAGFMQHEPTVAPDAAWTFVADDAHGIAAGKPILCSSPGRAYVGGKLCQQFDHRALGAADGLPTTVGSVHAYIDVWDQYVSAFEDERIADAALGGRDTTGRLRTISRVGFVKMEQSELRAAYSSNEDRGAIAVDLATATPADNALYRFEVHASGAASTLEGPKPFAASLMRPDPTATSGTLTIEGATDRWTSGTFLEIPAMRDPSGAIAAMRIVSALEKPGTYAVTGVPAKTPTDIQVRPIASVLWSRDNAHAVFAVTNMNPTDKSKTTRITLADGAGRSELLHGGDNAVAVLTTPALSAEGLPGYVLRIIDTNTDTPGVVDITVEGVVQPLGQHATLRMWDGILPVDSVPVKGTATGDLKVSFSAIGVYRTGDFWSALVRPDAPRAQRLDWPLAYDKKPAYAAPDGIDHAYALLGEIAIDAQGDPHVARDFRVIWSAPGDASLADFFGTIPQPIPDTVVPPPASAAAEKPPAPIAPPDPPPAPPKPQRETEAQHVPDGALLLAHRLIPGYERTGSIVEAVVDRPVWRYLGAAPFTGPTQTVVCDGILYALFESGDLASFDPIHPEHGWIRRRRFAGERTGYAACASAGRIYVAGGRDARGRPSNVLDVYDPHHDTWTVMVIPLRAARADLFAVAGLGKSLIVGGGERRSWIGTRYRSQSVERYDLESERVAAAPPLIRRMAGVAATTLQGNVYLIAPGGRDVQRLGLRTAEWSLTTILDDTVALPAIVAINDETVIVADRENGTLTRVHVRTGDTVSLPDVPSREAGFVGCDGTVYAIGGREGGMASAAVWALTLVDRLQTLRKITHHHEDGGAHGTTAD